MQNNLKGKQGEKIAEGYLKSKGYEILETNFRYSRIAEIDIIAKTGKTLVFVEVKTRTSEFFGSGAEAVDNKKLSNIYAALQYYIHKKKLQNLKPRIDVISILLDKNSFSINHIENIEI
ncbi:YraN family protein [bacterium]|nr:YraN family protein [bacterium]